MVLPPVLEVANTRRAALPAIQTHRTSQVHVVSIQSPYLRWQGSIISCGSLDQGALFEATRPRQHHLALFDLLVHLPEDAREYLPENAWEYRPENAREYLLECIWYMGREGGGGGGWCLCYLCVLLLRQRSLLLCRLLCLPLLLLLLLRALLWMLQCLHLQL